MNGNELIDYINKNGLQDFKIEVSVTDGVGANGWINYRRVSNLEFADIGHSDKIVIISGDIE